MSSGNSPISPNNQHTSPNYKPALIYSNAGLDDTRHIGKTKVVIVNTST